METLIQPTLKSEKMYGIQTVVICIDLTKEFADNRLNVEITERWLSVTKIDYKRQNEKILINMLSLTELSYQYLLDMA